MTWTSGQALGAEPASLSLILGTHMVKGESQLLKGVLGLHINSINVCRYKHTCVQACMRTHTNK